MRHDVAREHAPDARLRRASAAGPPADMGGALSALRARGRSAFKSCRTISTPAFPFFVFQGSMLARPASWRRYECSSPPRRRLRWSVDLTASMPGGAHDMAVYATSSSGDGHSGLQGCAARSPRYSLDALERLPNTHVGCFEMHPSFAQDKVAEREMLGPMRRSARRPLVRRRVFNKDYNSGA